MSATSLPAGDHPGPVSAIRSCSAADSGPISSGVDQPHLADGGRGRAQATAAAPHPTGLRAGGDAVAEPAVDPRLGGVQGRERLAAGGDVVELARISAVSRPRRVWSARTPTWVTAAVSSTAPPGTAIRHGNDVAGAHERVARVHAARAVRLVGGRGPRPPVVVERRRAAERRRTGHGRPAAAAAQLARLVAQVGLPTS